LEEAPLKPKGKKAAYEKGSRAKAGQKGAEENFTQKSTDSDRRQTPLGKPKHPKKR
jgi:hypothetical protein